MKCKICNNDKDNKTFSIKENMFGTGESFNFLECSVCECLQLTDTVEDMSAYYPDNYYSFDHKTIKENPSLKMYLTKKRNMYAVSKKGALGKLLSGKRPSPIFSLLGETNITPESHILDIGCGSGKLLNKLKEIRYNNLLGIDPFIDSDIIYPNGLRIEKKEIADIKGKWDLIMFNQKYLWFVEC